VRGLTTLGNLPACLGYVGLVVVMLHSAGPLSRIRVLAPAGRMALTNYLMQSLICMTWFYGFGLGHWGLPRAQQVLFVLVIYALQIAFSHWWLARFRYGPMEWLWRGFTYREVPPLRIEPATRALRRRRPRERSIRRSGSSAPPRHATGDRGSPAGCRSRRPRSAASRRRCAA
jgi:uncharacterized protein